MLRGEQRLRVQLNRTSPSTTRTLPNHLKTRTIAHPNAWGTDRKPSSLWNRNKAKYRRIIYSQYPYSDQFEVYDSYGNRVYYTNPIPVSANGTVSWSWAPPFADTFTVWAVSEGYERQQVMVIAAYQPDASGFVTGGGWLELADARQTFGFVAQVQRNGSLRGSLEYQDHYWQLNLKSFAIDWVYVPHPNEGYFSGWATLNGSGAYRFRVALWDGGTPGTSDMFMLWVYDDMNRCIYSVWGTLAGGNLMIHLR